MTRPDHPATPLSLGKLVFAVGIVFAASMLGQYATLQSLTDWYAQLNKPWFTPPGAVFPIAWSILYALMALAFWRILRLPSETPGRNRAAGVFLVQLALNALWSFAFFGHRSPIAGLAVIALLDFAVVATSRSFRKLDGTAGAMLLPYLAWLAFATLLNLAIWYLN